MDERYDVVVIGAGIVGVATALHLLMRGKKVLLLDRGGIGQETSFGNAGIIQTHDTLPFGVPPLSRLFNILCNRDTAVRVRYRDLPYSLPWILDFYLQSRSSRRHQNGQLMRPLNASALDEHRFLMKGTDAERHLSLTGRIALYRSQKSFEKSRWELQIAQDMKVPFEILDPLDLAVLEPHLKPHYYKAVRWTSSARLTDPFAVTSSYAARFQREGGHFMQAEAQRFSALSDETWVLETPHRKIIAGHIVVCAGPWAQQLLRSLGYHFPLGIKRGYHRHFSLKKTVFFNHAFTDIDIGYVMAPLEQGCRLLTGVEFACLHAPPDPYQLRLILPFAKQLFPLEEPVETTAWCGARPCFADSRPVIAAAPRHKGLWLNMGHGHSGMTTGPSSARLLAELMMGEKPFCDPAPYRADRFHC